MAGPLAGLGSIAPTRERPRAECDGTILRKEAVEIAQGGVRGQPLAELRAIQAWARASPGCWDCQRAQRVLVAEFIASGPARFAGGHVCCEDLLGVGRQTTGGQRW